MFYKVPCQAKTLHPEAIKNKGYIKELRQKISTKKLRQLSSASLKERANVSYINILMLYYIEKRRNR